MSPGLSVMDLTLGSSRRIRDAGLGPAGVGVGVGGVMILPRNAKSIAVLGLTDHSPSLLRLRERSSPMSGVSPSVMLNRNWDASVLCAWMK